MLFIFDLDQTLVDSKIALQLRNQRVWSEVYQVIPKMKLYPYIKETLEYLQSKEYNISIVTTSPGSYAKRVLSHFGFPTMNLIAFHDVSKRKPHPEAIIKAMAAAGELVINTVSFGDRKIDIEASKQAGVISCACFWDTNESEYLKKSDADYSFFSTKEMYDFMINKY